LKVEHPIGSGPAVLQVMAVSNRTYTVQFTDNLSAGSWTRLADVLARTNTHLELVVDPKPSTNRYYRLATPRQPLTNEHY